MQRRVLVLEVVGLLDFLLLGFLEFIVCLMGLFDYFNCILYGMQICKAWDSISCNFGQNFIYFGLHFYCLRFCFDWRICVSLSVCD